MSSIPLIAITWSEDWSLFGLGYFVIQIGGLVAAARVIMSDRTTQGTVAWGLLLITFPLFALPLFLVFGFNKLGGYVKLRRSKEKKLKQIIASFETGEDNFHVPMEGIRSIWRVMETLGRIRFTGCNHADLLIDGEAIFESMLAGIASARRYLIVQFFIINDDSMGYQLADALIQKANEGVKVFLLYDEVGSRKTSRKFWKRLRAAGVEVEAFGAKRKFKNPWRLNFRNHRKIIIADGRTAWVGGMNIGNEYLGMVPKFGPWRDTHVRVSGPAVQGVQLAFLDDWYWVTGEVPELEWRMRPCEDRSDQRVLPLPSGPDDETEVWLMTFLAAIHSARRRIWVHSPYFVPDEQIISALQLATLRGVDVRIVLPEKPDHTLVWLSSFYFIALPALRQVKFFRYQPGFLHSKVVLVDDHMAAVGTANLDNRSLRINFELMMVFADTDFCSEVERMMEVDLSNCREVGHEEYHNHSILFRVAVRAARLLSPIQ